MDSKYNVVKQQIVNEPHHHTASPSNEHSNRTAGGNENPSDDSKPMVEHVNGQATNVDGQATEVDGQATNVDGQAADVSRPRTYESAKLFYGNKCCSVQ